MASSSLLLNALFESGNNMGGILAAIFGLLMAIEMIFVFIKYVITSDK